MSNDRYANIRQALAMGPTPGPWSIRETATHVTVIGADNGTLFHDDKRLPLVIADARLIAAAPELLKALTKCVEVMSNGGTWTLEDHHTALAAITKATGER